jgi:twitching motility two-component system response regulator PilH
MAIKNILIVDDSKTELMFMTDLLGKNGFSVKTAENAEDAFRRLAEEKPDLILMDVVMPGQNGFQLTRAITRDPLYADVPIIMCTSKNQETDRVWGMRQGAKDYITKPVDASPTSLKHGQPTSPPRIAKPIGREAASCQNAGGFGLLVGSGGGRGQLSLSAQSIGGNFSVGERTKRALYAILVCRCCQLAWWSVWHRGSGEFCNRKDAAGAQ